MRQKLGIDTSHRIDCPIGYDPNLWEELCGFQAYTILEEREFLERLLENYPNISDQFRYDAICKFIELVNI